MPRDFSRPPLTSSLRRRAASPVSALAAFSALVAVSVAVSSGIAPAADFGAAGTGQGAAFGPAGADAPRPGAGWSLLAAGPRTQPPAAPLRDERSVSVVRDGAAGDGSWRPGAGRGDGGTTPSTARPGRHAPPLYDGELPVNTIIAPTSPGAVLHGGAFGRRTAPDHGRREFHNGADISAAAGLPVVAAVDGEVTAVFWDEWGGNRVEVAHAEGMTTTYSHLEDVQVEVGDRLAASEQLGSVGATGVRVTGPHLHFETWVDGEAVDPQSFDWIDGIHVIPASRGKYSLEVPVPDPAAEAVLAAAPARPGDRTTARKSVAADEQRTPVKSTKKDTRRASPATPVPAPSEPKTPPKTEPKTRQQVPQQPVQPAGASPVQADPVPVVEPVAPVVSAPTPVEPVSPVLTAPAPEGPVLTAPAPEEPVVVGPAPEEPAAAPAPAEPVVIDSAPKDPQAGAPDSELGVAPVAVPDAERDADGDGVLDVEDPDLDGDGTPDELDDDLDGDGIPHDVDPDVDGDGLRNDDDPDVDGDGLLNDVDEQPRVPAAKAVRAAQAAQPAAATEPAPTA